MRQPTFVFIVDSHIESLTSGLFTSALSSIKQSLDSIPNPENTSICILTVDSQVQCYTMTSSESLPKIYVIQDQANMFCPVPGSTLLMNVANDRDKIDALLDKLPEIHNIENNKSLPADFCFSSAVLVAKDLLNESGG